MRIAYLECFSGMSGDMFLGALVDAGVPPRVLEETVAALGVGARLEISRVVRSGISATKVDVYVNGEKDLPREEYWKAWNMNSIMNIPAMPNIPMSIRGIHILFLVRVRGQGRPRITRACSRADGDSGDHFCGFDFGGREEDCHCYLRGAGTRRRRRFTILPSRACIFTKSARWMRWWILSAPPWGLRRWEWTQIICSPLNVGGGTVKCAHGTFPVPAPATVELLKDAPVYSSGLQAELVTPTGAAIVKTLASRFAAFPEMKIEKSGYGAGSRDFPGHPNVVRLTIGESCLECAGCEDRVRNDYGAGSESR